METMYVLNVSLAWIIVVSIGVISLAMIIFLTSKENKQLKLLVRIIDLMAYVYRGTRSYDIEIAKIANKLSLSTMKSVQGNFSSRYPNLVHKLTVLNLGSLLYDHGFIIMNNKKRDYLVNIIRNSIDKFSPDKLAKMLSDLIASGAKNKLNYFKLYPSDEEIKELILDIAVGMTSENQRIFISEFDISITFECNLIDEDINVDSEIREKSKLLLKAEVIKVLAQFKS